MSQPQTPVTAAIPSGPELAHGQIPTGTQAIIAGPLKSNLRVANNGTNGDAYYLEVEGALSPSDFAKLKSTGGIAALTKALDQAAHQLSGVGAIPIKSNAEIGYFKFWLPYQPNLLGALKQVTLTQEYYFDPVHYDLNAMKLVKDFTSDKLGLTPRIDGRSSSDAFSGLSSIGAIDFVKKAQDSIGGGVIVNGSSVKIGITDTGITYNHPTFLDAAGGKPRITYMKDFTGEGRVYFNPASAFKTTAAPSGAPYDFTIDAQWLASGVLPNVPAANDFKTLIAYPIQASDDLKTYLADKTMTPIMGFLLESAFQGGENAVDINANGKLNDQIPVIYFHNAQDSTKDRIFVDFSAQGDFSKSKPMGNFNDTKDVTPVFAEKIGFDIKGDQLLQPGASDPVAVLSASIVGYDPGDHGTHVSGIAAGRKTIANDPDDTLAHGVAPQAQIYMNRVCANNGGCGATDAMIDLALNGHVDVINMSLGGLSPFNDGYGVQETVLNRLTSVANVLFSVAAGNEGPGHQTVGSPSVARLSLSVGAAASRSMIERQYQWPGTEGVGASLASDDDEFMLYFSSRGPTAAGGFKPNLSAPGTELSSVQLNAAPGGHAGLDVYWGTSMATPAATGAYALLLDGIRKYNIANPATPITTDVIKIREIMIETARPFAQKLYSWIDEGTGMINLSAAWDKLLATRGDFQNIGVIDSKGNPVELDYEVLTSQVAPTGSAYNGTRTTSNDGQQLVPAFGTGVYLDYFKNETLRQVQISRHLPERLASSDEAGALTAQLETTAEDFALKTDFGNDPVWIKAGVREELNCADSEVSNLKVLGRGADITRNTDGTGSINDLAASDLNICIDRAKLASLPPGDHGALIYGYRTDGTKTAGVASFVVPVYVTVPQQTLKDNTAYDISGTVPSFGVAKNYIMIPKGTSAVRITLDVPAFKDGDACSGVLLMMLEGGNTQTSPETVSQLRAYNCGSAGNPSTTHPQAVITRNNPTPGLWDVHLFGLYQYKLSQYHLRVDYLVAETSVQSIVGDASALTGSLVWKLTESSFAITPDATKSTFTIDSLYHRDISQVAQDKQVNVVSANGVVRKYPASVKSVSIDTGGAPGDDIDLQVFECPGDQADDAPLDKCTSAGISGTPTDVEHVAFTPKPDKTYVAQVTGYDVKDGGQFFCDEKLSRGPEQGTVTLGIITGGANVGYSFSTDAIKASSLLNDGLVTGKHYSITGQLLLVSQDGVSLSAIPVKITP